MLKIIAEDFCNNKSNLFCFFVDFRKAFDTVPRNNLWNKLEELKVPLELRVVAIRLYENFILNLRALRGGRKILTVTLELNKAAPSPLPFSTFTSIS